MVKKLLLTLLAVMPLAAWALTLDEARRAAYERYPELAEANLIALTADCNLQAASRAWLPQPELSAQGTWQSAVSAWPPALNEMLQKMGVNAKGMSHWQYKAQAQASQLIYDGGEIAARKGQIRAQAAADKASVEVDMYALRERVDDLYFSILLLDAQAQTVEASVTLLEASLKQMQALLANGAAMRSDADAVEAELLTTRQQLTSVTANARGYRTVLELFTGLPCNDIVMPEMLVVPSTDEASGRPELQFIDSQKEAIKSQKGLIDAAIRPRVGAFVQGQWGYPGLNFMESIMNHRPRWGAVIGVNVTLQLGNYYTRKPQLDAMRHQLARTDSARETFLFNMRLQAARQRADIERARAVMADDDRIVELRANVRRAAEAMLREGVVDVTTLLRRIQQEKEASVSAAVHRLELLQSLYRLNTTLGHDYPQP